MNDPFSNELDLRRWLERQLNDKQIPFSKVEPALNSTLGLPDYHIQSLNLHLELKHAHFKPRLKCYKSSVRPNQRKQLKRLSHSSNVFFLISLHLTSKIYIAKITPETLSGTFIIDSKNFTEIFCMDDILSLSSKPFSAV